MAREPGAGEREAHGRYYAEYVSDVSDEPQGQLQRLLDEKDAVEWHLVGVVGGLPGGGIIFFWDTERPSLVGAPISAVRSDEHSFRRSSLVGKRRTDESFTGLRVCPLERLTPAPRRPARVHRLL